MDELPAAGPRTGVAGALAGDAVTDPLEAAELLDVDVDQATGLGVLVADERRRRLQIPHPAQSRSSEHSAHRRRRGRRLLGDLLAGPALAPKGDDLLDDLRRRRPSQLVRSRRAVFQAGRPLRLEPTGPLPNRLDVDAHGRGHGRGRLTSQHPPRHLGSTDRRRAGIPMQVHPVPPRLTEASQPQPSRSGPDGQPIESSQLAERRLGRKGWGGPALPQCHSGAQGQLVRRQAESTHLGPWGRFRATCIADACGFGANRSGLHPLICDQRLPSPL